ncbi:MAG: AAA-like domain-containing protein [Limisphaerales bacterium]
MNLPDRDWFSDTGGALPPNAASYVERAADRELIGGLREGVLCYVLTARQMGKSSLTVRTGQTLRSAGLRPLFLDLSALGQNLQPDQWYGDIACRLGRQSGLEEEVEDWWGATREGGPVARLTNLLREVIVPAASSPVIVFVDEADAVRSLPFKADEFFIAIRQCFDQRASDPVFRRLTFCILGVATPAELIRDTHTTPFNLGRRIELEDFTPEEARPLAQGLAQGVRGTSPARAERLLERVLHWTGGHPFLTQQLCGEILRSTASDSALAPGEMVDRLCEELFFSARSRDQNENLLYVKGRILGTESDLHQLLALYGQVLAGKAVPDDENNDLVNQLRLAGIVKAPGGHLQVRNRIYARVFDRAWIEAMLPDGELERPDGTRLRLGGTCSIGRALGGTVVLSDSKVSRQHALIQAQSRYEFWLMDLGSANGTFLNGRRVIRPELLRSGDVIEVGPFRLRFRQSHSTAPSRPDSDTGSKTLQATLITH